MELVSTDLSAQMMPTIEMQVSTSSCGTYAQSSIAHLLLFLR